MIAIAIAIGFEMAPARDLGELALFSSLSDPGTLWMNPARLSLGAEPGAAFGLSSFPGYSEYRAKAHLPGRVSLGYEYGGGLDAELRNHTLALAKTGFGKGWAEGFSLGLDVRRSTFPDGEYAWGGGLASSRREESMLALDAGLIWRSGASARSGHLGLGLFSMQSGKSWLDGNRMGGNLEWISGTGAWELGSLILVPGWGSSSLDDPGFEYSFGSIPYSRFGFLYHPEPWVGMGADFIPTGVVVMKAVSEPLLPGAFRQIRLGMDWWVGGPMRSLVRGGMEIRFGTERNAVKRRMLAARPPDVVDSSANPAAGIGPLQPSLDSLWNNYEKERIGFFRGVAWPYLNTFGYITTFGFPAGTSSLAVGNTLPGFGLLLAWGGLALTGGILSALEEEDAALFTYVTGQIALKLIDLQLARKHVKDHNGRLRSRYRLGIGATKSGVQVAASLAY